MTVTQPNLLLQFLTAACLGGLVNQMLEKQGVDPAEFPANTEAVERCLNQLNDLGINAASLTTGLLQSLCALHAKPENAEVAARSYAALLWKILGDPEAGGKEPPAIYFKAGTAVHAVMVALLDPDVFDD